MIGVALGPQSEIKVSAKVDTQQAGDRVYRLILSFRDDSECGRSINSLQLSDGFLGELALSHR